MIALAFTVGLAVGVVAGAVLLTIFMGGSRAEREHDAYRRGYQLGLMEPRQ